VGDPAGQTTDRLDFMGPRAWAARSGVVSLFAPGSRYLSQAGVVEPL